MPKISGFWRKQLRDEVSELWRGAPIMRAIADPTYAIYHVANFEEYDTTDLWTLTNATAGTGAVSTAEPGTFLLDSNSTTDTQGAQLQRTGGAFFVPAAGKDIWFEARIKVVDTIAKAQVFVGLANVDTTIIASSLMSATDILAFYSVSEDGVLLFAGEKGGVAATETGPTLVEDTYVNLGFRTKGITTAQMYVNGVKYGDPIATTSVPILKLVPSFVCQTAGTNDPIMHIQGYRVLQLR